MTTEARTITPEDVAHIRRDIADELKACTRAEIQFLYNRLFDEELLPEDQYPAWLMAGEFLKIIVHNLDFIIKEIEENTHIPCKLKEVTT